MKAIWCTMKATCAISASANGPDTVQNGRLRSASRRVQDGSACDGSRRGRGLPRNPEQNDRHQDRHHHGGGDQHRVGEIPSTPISSTSSGATTMPPKLAPLSASEIASPRLRVNHWLMRVGMVTRPSPSQPNDIVR